MHIWSPVKHLGWNNFAKLVGELRFLDSHTAKLSELYRKTNLGELALNGNSPN